jgi:hypothetical protein
MQKTLNHTGRKKIRERAAVFTLAKAAGEAPLFDVSFHFDVVEFPADARLYVEAYHKETRQRFDFGTLANIRVPANRKLDEIDLSGPTRFRVIIVNERGRHGLLLASGEGFSADEPGEENEESKSSLMAVVTRPLGQKAWCVSFAVGGKPELCLNENIPNAIEKMKTDSLFQSLILPAALKEVLTYYAWNDEEEGDHVEQWMALAGFYAEPKPGTTDPNDLLKWIDEVVEGFVLHFGFCDKLVDSLMRSEVV